MMAFNGLCSEFCRSFGVATEYKSHPRFTFSKFKIHNANRIVGTKKIERN